MRKCVAVRRRLPGEQSLSLEGALLLAYRGTEKVTQPDGTERWRFSHDRRVQGPSPMYFSEEQVRAYLTSILCPTLVLFGTEGIPFDEEKLAGRKASLRCEAHYKTLPGSHHLHLDPSTAPAVSAATTNFLDKYVASKPPAHSSSL